MKRLLFLLSVASLLNAGEQATIPVVDLNDFYDDAKHEIFMQELSDALHTYGFFAVKNVGMDPAVINEAFTAFKGFCSLDPDVKDRSNARGNNGQRGYVAFRTEVAKGAKFADFKEYYHVSPELTEEQYERLGYYRNVWPEEYDLRGPVLRYIRELEKYKLPLEKAFSELLGQREDFVSNMTGEGDCLMRLIHYPAPDLQDPNDQAVWAGAHTDIDFYTILPPATAEGLELQTKEGEWILVHVPDDTFIVNVGDFFENISNGYFRSGPHRVKSPLGKSDQERYSIVFFIHPRSTDQMGPLENMIEFTGGVRKFANATRWELLMERLVDTNVATESMMEELSKSGLMERLIEVGRASPDAMKRLKERGLASEAVLAELEK